MNEILTLKGSFEQRSNTNKLGPGNLPKGQRVLKEHLSKLKQNLRDVSSFWEDNNFIKPLISVYYCDVISKSNRIKAILENSLLKNNSSVVGAKFTGESKKKHIITHCVSLHVIVEAIENLKIVESIVEEYFNGIITYSNLEAINSNKFAHIFNKKNGVGISKSRFVNTIIDAYHVEKFGIEKVSEEFKEQSIVTIYDTGVDAVEIMNKLGIDFSADNTIDATTILLTPNQFEALKSKAPYLISMAVSDIREISTEEMSSKYRREATIPSPRTEPTVGVIDTMFDETVYFSEWVEFENMLSREFPLSSDDYKHGTSVTSIVVDGPRINPELEDGCGRFKVKHFGVATHSMFSSFTILKLIKEIVEANPNIKVWNLSLGSALEINPNFISPEAAILDKIQYDKNVIFIVSGTNKTIKYPNVKRIGAPADSINSIVVNSVDFNHEPAPYTREGGVLSFYNKPDISYYGGVSTRPMRVCDHLGESLTCGTSFAAPWITRKIAYLIEVLGMTREVAKALIIDTAAGWSNQKHGPHLIGFGVVPKHINDIIKTPDDEIKFIINEKSEKYDTYNYNLPVPIIENDKQPFIAKATLCYFPNCSRSQGVDYTNTEMDLYFGRITDVNGKKKINTINDNVQVDEETKVLYEDDARNLFRKWDNVKHIRENITTAKGKPKRAKKASELWGISIKTKERLNTGDGENLNFGLVITLKEINGKNRIEDFIQQCLWRGWYVSRINVKTKVDIYNRANEDIVFE